MTETLINTGQHTYRTLYSSRSNDGMAQKKKQNESKIYIVLNILSTRIEYFSVEKDKLHYMKFSFHHVLRSVNYLRNKYIFFRRTLIFTTFPLKSNEKKLLYMNILTIHSYYIGL